MKNFKEIYITKNSNGIVNKDIKGYKATKRDSIITYAEITILKDSPISILEFNISMKRVKAMVVMDSKITEVLEINFSDLIYCKFNDTSSKAVDSLLVSYKLEQKNIVDIDKLRNILTYASFCIAIFILGTLVHLVP